MCDINQYDKWYFWMNCMNDVFRVLSKKKFQANKSQSTTCCFLSWCLLSKKVKCRGWKEQEKKRCTLHIITHKKNLHLQCNGRVIVGSCLLLVVVVAFCVHFCWCVASCCCWHHAFLLFHVFCFASDEKHLLVIYFDLHWFWRFCGGNSNLSLLLPYPNTLLLRPLSLVLFSPVSENSLTSLCDLLLMFFWWVIDAPCTVFPSNDILSLSTPKCNILPSLFLCIVESGQLFKYCTRTWIMPARYSRSLSLAFKCWSTSVACVCMSMVYVLLFVHAGTF